MNQVIRILKKDLCRFRRAIFVSLALLVFYGWYEGLGWGPLVDNNFHNLVWAQSVTTLVVIWWLLITMVVHEEKLAGNSQFWLTRPYGRGNLLAAKLIFVAVTILLPLFIARIYLLMRSGFALWRYLPGLVWTQLLPAVFIILPLTALASMTRNRRQVMLSVMLVALCLGGMGWLSLVAHGSGLSEFFAIFGRQPMDTMAALKPLIAGARVALVTGTCGGVLVLQYLRRDSSLSLWMTAVGATLLAGTVLLPGTFLVARFYPLTPASQSPVRFELLRPSAPSSQPEVGGRKIELGFPILASATSGESAIVVDGILLDLETAEGLRWSSGWQSSKNLLMGRRNDFAEYFLVDRDFFDRANAAPVKARISLALTVLKLQQPWQRALPLGEFRVPDAGLCSAVYKGLLTDSISCLSPLPAPAYVLAGTEISASTCESGPALSPFKEGVVYGLPVENDADLPGPGISSVQERSYLLSSIENSAAYEYRFSGSDFFCVGTPITFRRGEVAQRALIYFEAGAIRLSEYRDHHSVFADIFVLHKKSYQMNEPTEAGH